MVLRKNKLSYLILSYLLSDGTACTALVALAKKKEVFLERIEN
jgi:hypothetical protein